jgi:MFS family permease
VTRSTRLLLASLCLLQVATGINWSVYFAFAGFYFRDKLGLSVATISILVSSAFLTYCLTQFVVSLLLDLGVQLIGERWMLLRSPALYAVGMGILAFGPGPGAVVVGGAVAGFGAATSPLMLAAMASRTSKRQSGLVASLLNASYLAGQLGALVVGWLLVRSGRTGLAFAGLGWLWLVVFGILLVTLRPEPTPHRALRLASPFLRKLVTSLGETRQLLADRRTGAIKALIFLAGVAPVLAGIYIPLYFIGLVQDPGQSAGYISASTALGYVLGGFVTPALGVFIDRHQNASQTLLAVLVIVTGAVALLSRVHDPLVASALAVALTLGFQCVNMLQNAVLLQEVTRESPTSFFAVNQLPFYAGLPVGLALGITAVSATGSVDNALLVVAAMFGLSAAIWTRHLQRRAKEGSARAHSLTG